MWKKTSSRIFHRSNRNQLLWLQPNTTRICPHFKMKIAPLSEWELQMPLSIFLFATLWYILYSRGIYKMYGKILLHAHVLIQPRWERQANISAIQTCYKKEGQEAASTSYWVLSYLKVQEFQSFRLLITILEELNALFKNFKLCTQPGLALRIWKVKAFLEM